MNGILHYVNEIRLGGIPKSTKGKRPGLDHMALLCRVDSGGESRGRYWVHNQGCLGNNITNMNTTD